MITIKRHYEKYKMRFSEPGTNWPAFMVEAENIDEANEATKHYYNPQGHDKSKCPICKKLARRYFQPSQCSVLKE